MACDQARLTATAAAQEVAHPDNDYHSGRSFQIRCDVAAMYVGGPNVTVDDGFLVPAGQPFGLNDSADELYYCVDAASEGAVVYVFWAGV